MPARHFPLDPNIGDLTREAEDLLRAIHTGDADALADLQLYHPHPPNASNATVADAQLVLARSYQAADWNRIVQACELIGAIWSDDVETVRELIVAHPNLLNESATIRVNSNWGPPMSFAANVGRDRIIDALHELGAQDHAYALDRAALQGRISSARKLNAMLGSPVPPDNALGGAAYTLNVAGTELLFEFGAKVYGKNGEPLAPVAVVLESDSRKPAAKHRILELYAEHGFELPDTPMMALHRGRIDLLEKHLRADPGLLTRTFQYFEIFPPDLQCGPEDLPRTTLDGATLLHVSVEFDELEIAKWLIAQGMDADVPAAIDSRGFGGHTALFGAVVSYPNFWGNYKGGWTPSPGLTDSPFARLLLDNGANPNARASMMERVWSDKERDWAKKGKTMHERRDLTPIGWGKIFHNRMIVNEPAMRIIEERGGRE